MYVSFHNIGIHDVVSLRLIYVLWSDTYRIIYTFSRKIYERKLQYFIYDISKKPDKKKKCETLCIAQISMQCIFLYANLRHTLLYKI